MPSGTLSNVIMLSVNCNQCYEFIMLSCNMLSGIMQNFIMLSAIMQNVIMLSGIIQNVMMLSGMFNAIC